VKETLDHGIATMHQDVRQQLSFTICNDDGQVRRLQLK